ncbi:MAG: YwqG family protein, partial [Microcystaceae cyanobacterium]
PKTVNYPTNREGDYLDFLAQINFAEIPQLENFPTQGILQFYIDGHDDLSGLDYDNPTSQDGFRVIYFDSIESDISNLVTDFNFLPDFDYSPIIGEFSLDFIPASSPITPMDAYFDIPNFSGDLLGVYEDWYVDSFGQERGQHQLGGYPIFTQNDPRFPSNDQQEVYRLLLQIDSDIGKSGRNEICWGDAGIGNFFIKYSQLKKLDFSDILYNWDCG